MMYQIVLVLGCPLFLSAALIFLLGSDFKKSDVKWVLIGMSLFIMSYYQIAKVFISK